MISSKKCEDVEQFQVKNRQKHHYLNSIDLTAKMEILSFIGGYSDAGELYDGDII